MSENKDEAAMQLPQKPQIASSLIKQGYLTRAFEAYPQGMQSATGLLQDSEMVLRWKLNKDSSSSIAIGFGSLSRMCRARQESQIQLCCNSMHLRFCSTSLSFLTRRRKLLPLCSSLKEGNPDNGRSKSVDSNAFCIIEGPETVSDFARLQLQEIQDNIRSRRNAIFLLLEEVRRLRIQQKLKSLEQSPDEDESEMPEFKSFIPFLPPLTSKTLRQYYATCLMLMAGIIMFGGLVAPLLELKLGPGGTTYKDFIHLAHLPSQLSEVDPIVASFSGGAVGVISSLIVVEINNVKQQEDKTCKYCHGTGYLACARCSATGSSASSIAVTNMSSTWHSSSAQSGRCSNCLGTGKVMCPTCLCTGMAMANESNPRFDPFD